MDNDLPGMELLRTPSGIVRTIESTLDALCVVLLILMTCITTIDVVGRYIFHAPLHGAYESNELLLGILVFAAIPRVTWHQQHLTVTVIDGWLSPLIRRLQKKILSLISASGLAILSYFLWLHGKQLADYGDMSHALQLPIAPFAFAIAIFTGIAALAAFLHLFIKQP